MRTRTAVQTRQKQLHQIDRTIAVWRTTLERSFIGSRIETARLAPRSRRRRREHLSLLKIACEPEFEWVRELLSNKTGCDLKSSTLSYVFRVFGSHRQFPEDCVSLNPTTCADYGRPGPIVPPLLTLCRHFSRLSR